MELFPLIWKIINLIEYHDLIENSVKMLAFMLDHADSGDYNAIHKASSEKPGISGINELKRTVSDLEEARKATINLIEDLTEEIEKRKKVEEDLRLSQQKLALHLNQTPLAAIEFDLKGNVVQWNTAAESIFGYSREESIGRQWSFYCP